MRYKIQYSCRMLRRNPAFAISSILVFTLCLGATAGAFAIVNALLLQPLPGFRDIDRLVAIWSIREDTDRYPFTVAEFLDYQNQTHTLEQVAAARYITGSLKTSHGAMRLLGARVSANFFEMAGTSAELGRTLERQDDRSVPESAPTRVVLLSHSLWSREFASRADILGTTIVINGQGHTVAGVLPGTFLFPTGNFDFITPLGAESDPNRTARISTNFLKLFGRLKPGETTDSAHKELNAIAARLKQEFPDANPDKTGIQLVPLRDQILGHLRTNALTVFAGVFLLLMVASLNMAGIFVVHALRCRHDLTVLTAIGTGPAGLFWHVLTQSTAVCLGAGVLGTALAQWILPKIVGLVPSYLAIPIPIALDSSVLLGSLGLSVLCGIIFGMPAALHAAKLPGSGVLLTSARTPAMHEDGGRRLLVMAEVAFCLVVVIGAGLLLRSFVRLEKANPGFRSSRLLTFRLALPPSKYPAREDAERLHDQVIRAIQTVPGVSVGTASSLPLNGSSGFVDISPGADHSHGHKILNAPYLVADESYFRTMEIPILAGRSFSAADRDSSAQVVVVSKTLADRLSIQKDPLGAHFQVDDNAGFTREVEVIGVAGDVSAHNLENKRAGAIYVPLQQVPPAFAPFFLPNMSWVVRTPGPPMELTGIVRDKILSVSNEVGLSNMEPMENSLDMALSDRRFQLRMIALFAAAVLVLAAIGLYALISHSVHQRRREIGVRVALGARSQQILMHVIGEGLSLALGGVAIGLGAMFVLSRTLSTMLFEVPVYDPLTIVAGMFLVVMVSVLATGLPALRAARLDPVVALRQKP
ncbi:MAG: ABC transporter permease [Acidobacteriota bacterium]|nr:ABC transporter permease [Acidobacteriota bacterium]